MSAAQDLLSTDICLAFKDVSICSLVPLEPVISNVSGFVKKGGITAVFGPSASGKSLLLQALAGRIQNMSITGNVFLNGVKVDPCLKKNTVSYVPQDTMLIGDLTAREMITNGARLKKRELRKCIDESVNSMLKDFGLDHVADTYIGTIFRSGLSGGQKRRVDVAVELIAAPSMLMLDEPTSGLDGSIAYDVLESIRNAVKAREASAHPLSVMLSIHQPNSRILDLFDHILVLGSTGVVFFGSVQESVQHFTKIGYAPPAKYTPTDFYLNATDKNFSKNKFDFVGAFNSSHLSKDLTDLMDLVESRGQIEELMQSMQRSQAVSEKQSQIRKGLPVQSVGAAELLPSYGDIEKDSVDRQALTECELMAFLYPGDRHTSFCTQFALLVERDFILAYRDPTLYILQVVLVVFFGLMIGAVFFDLKYEINASMNFIPGALLWCIMVMMYIQVFKVYHLAKSNERFRHENTNNAYSVLAAWCAELFSVSVLLITYIPGGAMGYFMAGFPGEAFPFIMLLLWLVSFNFTQIPVTNLGILSKYYFL